MTHQWDGGRGPTLLYEAFVVPACWTFTDRRNKSASDEEVRAGLINLDMQILIMQMFLLFVSFLVRFVKRHDVTDSP